MSGRLEIDQRNPKYALNARVHIGISQGVEGSQKRDGTNIMYSHNSIQQTEKTRSVCFRDLVQIPSTTYATFALYRYPAKFIPHVIAYILETYAQSGMSVFDPFAGYGTVGVVSKIYGHDYELWDLNPMLEILHKIATLEPRAVNVRTLMQHIKSSQETFIPQWSRMDYWFPEAFLPFLYRVWGYYHSLDDDYLKLLLTIPLLKTTRYFSYDDPQRQKLSKSLRSQKRVESLLGSDWRNIFFQLVEKEVLMVIKKVEEYHTLRPHKVRSIVKGGVDTFTENLQEKRDILITSPPYLQSQEYLRQAKLDLFWLGYSEEKVKELSKLEIPYREVVPYPICSQTFYEYESQIEEQHIKTTFDRYFWGVLSCLSRLQESITTYLFIFVGHASIRGRAIPIDQIFVEHFAKLGWKHQETLVDRIVSRRLFSYRINPATGLQDMRTPVENLVVLKRSS